MTEISIKNLDELRGASNSPFELFISRVAQIMSKHEQFKLIMTFNSLSEKAHWQALPNRTWRKQSHCYKVAGMTLSNHVGFHTGIVSGYTSEEGLKYDDLNCHTLEYGLPGFVVLKPGKRNTQVKSIRQLAAADMTAVETAAVKVLYLVCNYDTMKVEANGKLIDAGTGITLEAYKASLKTE